MAKQLEIKKLFEQLLESRVLTQVEPSRYVVNDGFVVHLFDKRVTQFTVKPSDEWVEAYPSNWLYGKNEVVEYALFKEVS